MCQSVCEQDNCKRNQLISLKPGVTFGPINRKNLLTFGNDPVSGTDSGHFNTSLTIAEQGILGDLFTTSSLHISH